MNPSAMPSAEELLTQAAWARRLAGHLVKNPADAEDLAQSTWLVSIEKGRPPGVALRAWMTGVMTNLARFSSRTTLRRQRHETAVVKEALEPGTRETVAEGNQVVERLDAHQKLAAVVMGLREPYRSTISQSLRQMGAPLPAEPVGVGAEWEVSARTPMSAMPLDVTTHYKVLELGRSRLVAEITSIQRLRPRNAEGLGKELQRLSAFSAEGRGRVEVDLTHMVQVGNLQITIRMETGSLRAGDAGVKGPMVLETTFSSSSTRL